MILGFSLWPWAHEAFLLSKWLGLSMLGHEQFAAAERMLIQLKTVPLPLILITMALIPAAFEEICFRGFLFSALRTRLADDRTVIASALLFGLFHEILIPGRMLVSTLLGLVLGWVRFRTGSIFPGIVLHACYNGILMAIAHYSNELASRGWGVEQQMHLPSTWLISAAMGIIVGLAILSFSTRGSRLDAEVASITS